MAGLKSNLFDINLQEVSLVDSGDNPSASVVLFKRSPEAGQADITDEEIAKIIQIEKGGGEAGVVGLDLEDRPGAFASVVKILAKAFGVEEPVAIPVQKYEFNDELRREMSDKIRMKLQRYIEAFDIANDRSFFGEDDFATVVKTNVEQFNAAVSAALDEYANSDPADLMKISKSDNPDSGEAYDITDAQIDAVAALARDQLTRPEGESEEEAKGGEENGATEEGDDQTAENTEEVDMADQDTTTTEEEKEGIEKALSKADRDKLSPAGQKYVETLEAKASSGGGGSPKKPPFGKADDSVEDLDKANPLFKNMNTEQVAFIKSQQEEVALMKRQSEERDYIEKSRAAFGDLPVAHEELGPVLRRVEKGEGTAEDGKYLSDILGSVNNLSALGKSLGEVGTSVHFAKVAGSAAHEVGQKAEEIAKRDNISREVALGKVRKEHPELAERYVQENHAAS